MVLFAVPKGDYPQFTWYFLKESLTDHLLYNPTDSPLFLCGKPSTSVPFVNQVGLPERENKCQWKGQQAVPYTWQNALRPRRQGVPSPADSICSTVHSHSKENSAPPAMLVHTNKSVK